MDRQARIKILQTMYREVTPIGDDRFYCINGDEAVILNRDGGLLISGKVEDINIRGKFMVNKITREIAHVETMCRHVFSNSIISVEKLSDDYIAVESTNIAYIMDKYLQIVFKSDLVYSFACYNETSTMLKIRYTTHYPMTRGYILFNKLKNQVERYGETELTSEYSAVAVEENGFYKGTSKNRNSLNCFRYKLAKNGEIIGTESHEDIIKPVGIAKPTAFYSIDRHDKNEYTELNKYTGDKVYISSTSRVDKMGIIGTDGSELLPTLADSIDDIGSNNYIIRYTNLDGDKSCFVYNTATKTVIIDPMPASKCGIHDSLPIAIINLDSVTVGLDYKGRIFNICDIAKYFDCSYNKSNPGVIAIKVGELTKYVTNTLYTINNVHAIAKFKKDEWVKM